MTVTELIQKLQLMPPDAQVETEGCDCTGWAEGVSLDGNTVLITRTIDEGDHARRGLLYPLFDDDPIEILEIEETVKDV